MKPYQKISISECGEPLVPIPLNRFAIESPHPYQKLGASYDKFSPYHLRQSVLTALIAAQRQLQELHPGWQLKIFDAYRPVGVQQFMVDYTFAEVVRKNKINLTVLSEEQRQAIWQQVYQIWAIPSANPMTPPPHSTGAAIDLTLVDATGKTIDLGSAIDELSARSHPDYYASQPQQTYHRLRQLLLEVMQSAGFRRHQGEWWHFSLGDQMWAWLCQQENPQQDFTARYGLVQ
ncbi:MAG: M15 family metallopeptidase [Coleofasciculaceae cyanobacterium]